MLICRGRYLQTMPIFHDTFAGSFATLEWTAAHGTLKQLLTLELFGVEESSSCIFDWPRRGGTTWSFHPCRIFERHGHGHRK
jgi:hypothetical protein